MSKFKIGQTLFRPGENKRSQGGLVTIEKVGRKWLTVDWNERIAIETLETDARGCSAIQCYLTEQEYLEQKLKQEMWSYIVSQNMPYQCPDISLEEMETIASILSITFQPKKKD